jgi:hypothetical protein
VAPTVLYPRPPRRFRDLSSQAFFWKTLAVTQVGRQRLARGRPDHDANPDDEAPRRPDARLRIRERSVSCRSVSLADRVWS